jgi:hypothetical protein
MHGEQLRVGLIRVYAASSFACDHIPRRSTSTDLAVVMSTPAAAAVPSTRVGLVGSAAHDALNDLDWKLLNWLHQLKSDLPERPKQTGFRVFAILTYRPLPPQPRDSKHTPVSTPHPYDVHNYVDGTDQQLAYITGTNTEVRPSQAAAPSRATLAPRHRAHAWSIAHNCIALLRACVVDLATALLHRFVDLRRAQCDSSDAHEELQRDREVVHHG